MATSIITLGEGTDSFRVLRSIVESLGGHLKGTSGTYFELANTVVMAGEGDSKRPERLKCLTPVNYKLLEGNPFEMDVLRQTISLENSDTDIGRRANGNTGILLNAIVCAINTKTQFHFSLEVLGGDNHRRKGKDLLVIPVVFGNQDHKRVKGVIVLSRDSESLVSGERGFLPTEIDIAKIIVDKFAPYLTPESKNTIESLGPELDDPTKLAEFYRDLADAWEKRVMEREHGTQLATPTNEQPTIASETVQHVRRVTSFTGILADEINKPGDDNPYSNIGITKPMCFLLIELARLHDFGKNATPIPILIQGSSPALDRYEAEQLEVNILRGLDRPEREEYYYMRAKVVAESLAVDKRNIEFVEEKAAELEEFFEKRLNGGSQEPSLKDERTITPGDFETIKYHVTGTKIVTDLPGSELIRKCMLIMASHHVNATGDVETSAFGRKIDCYPWSRSEGNLPYEVVPFEARVMAIADKFEAQTGIRNYKKPFSVLQTLKNLHEDALIGVIDPLLFRFVMQRRIYERYVYEQRDAGATHINIDDNERMQIEKLRAEVLGIDALSQQPLPVEQRGKGYISRTEFDPDKENLTLFSLRSQGVVRDPTGVRREIEASERGESKGGRQ